jgi:hypothetical protein
MEFKTTVNIEPSNVKIGYSDPVMFIGSCFATSIGKKFDEGHMPVLINPSGTVYNPASVAITLDTITRGEKYSGKDLFNYGGTWLSFDHYTDFSSENDEDVLTKINDRMLSAKNFLSSARFLFITFGTARIYRFRETGRIVSNCHKIPGKRFAHELLTVEEIVNLWGVQLSRIKSLFPGLTVIFTISPVRHWKDGAHGNQVSKSILFLAIEELLKHPSAPGYFPAYELLMDDLRDYRFYDDDMLHPSSQAIDYIWQAFKDSYFDSKTGELYEEVTGISRAVIHRFLSGSQKEIKKFAETMLSRIDAVSARTETVNLSFERKYFEDLLK